ncbi:discoidin domain-containing protein [Planomonospora sp. ID67723]|uniref:galactose-binding domain-containing protein n=1 Tax=Planomonospora sp. ID67723 TaxID=2738134 RepID=UPI0018C3D13C|nr:discoidin domain-containing protein [Planomonospora sp. ID67723]MBG0829541.1 discoidin domain-containing protein [Planomonospora sp. ID67723]
MSSAMPKPVPRRLLWALAAITVLLSGLLVAAGRAEAAETLLSQGKPASSSSKEGQSYSSGKAVDGDLTSTRWASEEGADPQWIRVDLGAAQQISRVRLLWEAAYGSAYEIQVSDDKSTWTTVYSTTTGDGGEDDLTVSGSGRYVRMYGTERGTPYGYSLWELQVYGGGTPPTPTPTPTVTPTVPPGEAFTVAAAGDIAAQCTASSGSCAHPKTAALVERMNPAFVVTMGDNQYDDARISDYRNYYDKTWGRFKGKTRPVPGNHETYDPAGTYAGYKAYFGSIATPRGKTYYSYDHGDWHFVALDSNLFTDSAQLDWLKADLAANDRRCIAAYFHHPLFSSGSHGNQKQSKPVWEILYGAGADLVLGGHDHHYERFAPQNPSAAADSKGIVQVIGGMGGAPPYELKTARPNSQKRLTNLYGVLKLTLAPSSFSWQLVDVGGAVKDTSPTYTCH